MRRVVLYLVRVTIDRWVLVDAFGRHLRDSLDPVEAIRVHRALTGGLPFDPRHATMAEIANEERERL